MPVFDAGPWFFVDLSICPPLGNNGGATSVPHKSGVHAVAGTFPFHSTAPPSRQMAERGMDDGVRLVKWGLRRVWGLSWADSIPTGWPEGCASCHWWDFFLDEHWKVNYLQLRHPWRPPKGHLFVCSSGPVSM